MKDFSLWFNAQRGAHQGPEPWETPTPPVQPAVGSYDPIAKGDIWESCDEKGQFAYKAVCRVCKRDYELLGDSPQDFDPEYSYCGGSQGCCP